MKRRDLLRHLADNGCAVLREGARHSWHNTRVAGRRSAIPRHHEIDNHLAVKICRELGVGEPERF